MAMYESALSVTMDTGDHGDKSDSWEGKTFTSNGDSIQLSKMGGRDETTHIVKVDAPLLEDFDKPVPQYNRLDNIQLNASLPAGSLASQLCPLGPKDRCTPSQAQSMGQQVLDIIRKHETDKTPLPHDLQNTFDIFHRCLAVAYGTFFLNLYSKANAPCLLCHGCKSLYPPGQYIHHACPSLPPNILPCRSRMWRRCLVPLETPGMDKAQQKDRWKFVIEKFSHASTGIGRRNPLPPESDVPLLDMPECKRGRFVKEPDQDTPTTSSANRHRYNRSNSSPSPPLINDIQDDSLKTLRLFNTYNGSPDKTLSFPNAEGSRAIGLAEELVKEICHLQQELSNTQSRLQTVEDKLTAISNGSTLSEQLMQSLATQEQLTIERDNALKKAGEYEEKNTALEQQLFKIQQLQNEVQTQLSHFSSRKS